MLLEPQLIRGQGLWEGEFEQFQGRVPLIPTREIFLRFPRAHGGIHGNLWGSKLLRTGCPKFQGLTTWGGPKNLGVLMGTGEKILGWRSVSADTLGKRVITGGMWGTSVFEIWGR